MAFQPAKTVISIIVEGHSLLGGQTHSYVWNNAPKDRVYSLSARPIDGQNNSSLQNKVEIRNIKAMATGSPEKMKAYYDVHNWGTTWCDYWVIMAQTYFA